MIRRLVIALLAIAAVVSAAACGDDDDGDGGNGSRSPAGTPSADAFILYRDSVGDLVAQDLRTGETYRQTVDFNNEVVVTAQCSRDGSRIAYLKQVFTETDRRQLLIRGDNAPEEPLSLAPQTQSIGWSPDGREIAVSTYDGFDLVHAISALDIESGATREISAGEGFAGSLSWSPDGNEIAYYLQEVSGNLEVDVWMVNASGGEPRKVTSGGINWLDPDWAPDGSKLVITGLDIQTEQVQLYEVDPNGGEPRPLTQSEIFKRGPEYSPDGTQVAYTGSIVLPSVSRVPTAALHSFGIFLLNSDGTDERSLTADPRQNPGAQVDPYLDAFLLGWCRPGPWLDDLWVKQESTPTLGPTAQ